MSINLCRTSCLRVFVLIPAVAVRQGGGGVIPTIEWMIEQAEAAGQAALAALPEMESEIKADATVVTNIDRMVETWLREKIAARFPDHGFFGEESGQDHLGAEFLW